MQHECDSWRTRADWLRKGAERGWRSPMPAGWFWRLPGIRQARFFCLAFSMYMRLQYPPGHSAIAYHEWSLYAVYRGWA